MEEIINKEFEEMINDVCGPKKIKRGRPPGIRPTSDFYDLPNEEFMRWLEEKAHYRYCMKISAKCACGEEYIIFSEEAQINYPEWSEAGTTTDYHIHNENIRAEHFFCYKCGQRFVVSGSRIVRIESKSKQLEVVL